MRYLLLLVVLCCTTMGVSECSQGPEMAIYISTPKSGGMNYYDPVSDKSGFIPYSQTDKFICLTPTDAQTLFNYCKTPSN